MVFRGKKNLIKSHKEEYKIISHLLRSPLSFLQVMTTINLVHQECPFELPCGKKRAICPMNDYSFGWTKKVNILYHHLLAFICIHWPASADRRLSYRLKAWWTNSYCSPVWIIPPLRNMIVRLLCNILKGHMQFPGLFSTIMWSTKSSAVLSSLFWI